MTVPLITPRDWHSPQPMMASSRPVYSPTSTVILEVPISTAPMKVCLEFTLGGRRVEEGRGRGRGRGARAGRKGDRDSRRPRGIRRGKGKVDLGDGGRARPLHGVEDAVEP